MPIQRRQAGLQVGLDAVRKLVIHHTATEHTGLIIQFCFFVPVVPGPQA